MTYILILIVVDVVNTEEGKENE
ncbi:uncharacterized protein METZ01_LOCUS284016 [marine metagenome]|uniref:Uncharacterized protein n=1 Tax=marine metagenome TaxID=408172 RepID=A0A382L7F8_9ZZZZ